MNNTTNSATNNTIASLVTEAINTLSSSSLAQVAHVSQHDIRTDVEVLLAFCLSKARSYLHAWPEHIVNKDHAGQFENLVKKRCQQYPIAYLIGEQEFWSLSFKVTPEVLIPRPETECLVEFILEEFSNNSNASDSNGLDINGLALNGLDMGTGSGAIALSLAHEKPQWHIEACDISDAALAIAETNKQSLGINSVTFQQSNWFSHIQSNNFDFIVSNPPYIENQATELKTESIKFEPRSALCAGELGLDDIEKICCTAPKYLKPKGLLIIEHGAAQGLAVVEIFKRNNFTQVKCHQDYAGLDRFTVGYHDNAL